jgi:hypothetical protein
LDSMMVCLKPRKQSRSDRSSHVLSIDGLIRTKIAAGRKKDVEVLEELNGSKDLKERLGES